MHMIKTWNFDFAGMMATYVGKNCAQGKRKQEDGNTSYQEKLKLVVLYNKQKFGCQLSKKRNFGD